MIEWRKLLDEQYRRYNKTVFTVTELANAAGASRGTINVELNRLKKHGLMARYCHGRYGLPDVVTPEALLQSIDQYAYITGAYALYQHQAILQAPTRITCFTCRRHGTGRERITPVGKFVFVCVKKPIYAPPEGGAMADTEQAICDYVYLARRLGVRPESQVVFRNLQRLRVKRIACLLGRYPQTVARQMQSILSWSK